MTADVNATATARRIGWNEVRSALIAEGWTVETYTAVDAEGSTVGSPWRRFSVVDANGGPATNQVRFSAADRRRITPSSYERITWGSGAWRSDVVRFEVWTCNSLHRSPNSWDYSPIIGVAIDANGKAVRRQCTQAGVNFGSVDVSYSDLMKHALTNGPTGSNARATKAADEREERRVENEAAEVEAFRRSRLKVDAEALLVEAGFDDVDIQWACSGADGVVVPMETLLALLRRANGNS